MAEEPKALGSWAAVDESVRETIREYGWTLFQIPGKSSLLPWLRKPPWAYTVGLFHTYAQPEIVIVGVEGPIASRILQDFKDRIKGGEKLETGKEYIEFLESHNCVFRPVDRSHYGKRLQAANTFYREREFPAVQLVWSDPQGRYPWDEGSEFEKRLKGFQPLLFKS
ncbi:MAG TPA: DUF4262 domain-containing protein [Chloroflexia bacterium]|jgi:hypothetical protein